MIATTRLSPTVLFPLWILRFLRALNRCPASSMRAAGSTNLSHEAGKLATMHRVRLVVLTLSRCPSSLARH
ncbi:uncharacterized protein C8Q71DRAFT_744226 [Rhodofomes roseus]|uniref:Secreted protein n=1 Tax=Rhodofomes roseus TaxID=34475 RepID=A0ABQ8KNM7_9APHY|nr:uncharacterized protein C8Q71DRAFT_744226 [Rhodofomes roseus]KAH9839798.1 hypothetical protein C8Q71DRAFT_744226 [Rhodofomes roseus]